MYEEGIKEALDKSRSGTTGIVSVVSLEGITILIDKGGIVSFNFTFSDHVGWSAFLKILEQKKIRYESYEKKSGVVRTIWVKP